jgi:replicative DNA helicase/5S rRNA maturation endonuclease (ribonuclease M5)
MSQKTKCPECGSEDNLVHFDNGTSFCFTPACKYNDGRGSRVTLNPIPMAPRGITEATCAKYGVGIGPDGNLWAPYYKDGHVAAYKVRKPGKEFFWEGASKQATLFGLQACSGNRRIIIVEGELDALAAFDMSGYPAVSIRNASTAAADVKANLEFLETYEYVYVATDMDTAGRAAGQAIMELLRPGKGYLVTLPEGFKDACEMAGKGLGYEFKQCLYAARPVNIAGVISDEDIRSKALELFSNETKRRGVSTLFPSLDYLLGGFRPGEVTLVAGGTGVGKLLCTSTPVPTPTGWTTMGDLKPGDHVFGRDGVPKKVLFTSAVDLTPESYLISFDDGTSIKACKDHQWLVRFKPQNKERVVTTDKLLTTTGRRPNIPLPAAVQYPEQDLPMEPYSLGVWLGDGSKRGGRLALGDPELVECFGLHWRHEGGCEYMVYGLVPTLRTTGVLNNKHIPDVYFIGSVDQRLSLLQGLMDTDGTVGKHGQCTFDNTNPSLAFGVLELVRSLGGKASITDRVGKYRNKAGEVVECKQCYRVNFTVPFHVFRLERKRAAQKVEGLRPTQFYKTVVSVEPVAPEPMCCISVEDELYLVGHEYLVTHNTAIVRQLAVNLAAQKLPVFFIPLEMNPEVVALQMVEMVLQGNVFTSPEFSVQKIDEAVFSLTQYVKFFDHFGTIDPIKLINTIEYVCRVHDIKYVVLDHISAVVNGGEDERRGVDQCIAGLKSVALRLGLHILVVSHISRSKDDPDDNHPTLSKIRHSAGLAQYSDQVLGVQRARSDNKTEIKTLKVSRLWGQYGSAHLEWVDYHFQEATKKGGKNDTYRSCAADDFLDSIIVGSGSTHLGSEQPELSTEEEGEEIDGPDRGDDEPLLLGLGSEPRPDSDTGIRGLLDSVVYAVSGLDGVINDIGSIDFGSVDSVKVLPVEDCDDYSLIFGSHIADSVDYSRSEAVQLDEEDSIQQEEQERSTGRLRLESREGDFSGEREHPPQQGEGTIHQTSELHSGLHVSVTTQGADDRSEGSLDRERPLQVQGSEGQLHDDSRKLGDGRSRTGFRLSEGGWAFEPQEP